MIRSAAALHPQTFPGVSGRLCPEETGIGETVCVSHGHILMVDDDANYREGIRRLLRRHAPEWRVSLAGGVAAAWARLLHGGIDAVVTDLRMPVQDGFALLARVQEADWARGLPVIVLTGFGEQDLKQRALDAGATDVLNKPADTCELLARLRNALRLKAFADTLAGRNRSLAAQHAAAEERVRLRTAELARSQLELAWGLARAAEYRDQQTGRHLLRVSDYSRRIADCLGLADALVELVALASPLHDIGKLGIPDAILCKAGSLTPAEWEVMKQHCTIGAAILEGGATSSVPAVAVGPGALVTLAAKIARCHHEKWDGTGYPEGLKGEKIPLAARIVTLADAFDAMTSERPYKAALPPAVALERIRADVGRHFCPTVHAAFERAIQQGPLPRMDSRDKFFAETEE